VAKDTARLGTRGIYRAEVEASLPYLVCDADHHFYEPEDSMTRFLEPKYQARMAGQRPITR